MAEIEHFCDPDNKSHPKFANVANTEMTLYSANAQMSGLAVEKMTIGQYYSKLVVNSLNVNMTIDRKCCHRRFGG